MEIPQIIIKKALELKREKAQNVALKKELKKLEAFTLEEILFGDKKNKILKIDSAVSMVHSQLFIKYNSDDQFSLNLKKRINTLNIYLVDAIENNNSKSLLIFLFANCYLMINPKYFLSQDNIKTLSKRKISKSIFELLSKIKFNTSTQSSASHQELQLIKGYSEGILENNITKVYDFINAYERGSRGFHTNYLLERTCWFMLYLNYKLYIKLINNFTKPQEFIFFFQSLNDIELIKISNNKSISNNWGSFELIRQIIKRGDGSNEINIKSSDSIYERLVNLKQNNFDFLKQTISYFEDKILFNSSLGKFLTKVAHIELDDIISTSLLINKYSYKSEVKNYLLKYYAENSSEEQLNNLVLLIYKKWESFYETLYVDKDFYSNSIILTDYCDFIVEYFISHKTSDEIIEIVNEQLENLLNLDSTWFNNQTNQITYFYFYISKLYLLSYAYKFNQLNDLRVNLNFEKIKQDKIKCSRFDRGNKLENYFNVMNENINWLTFSQPKNSKNE